MTPAKPQAIQTGIEGVDKIPGRLELVEEGQEFAVIVDYAHTPDALQYLLNTVKLLHKHKRLILVFGCGGDRDRGKRPLMMQIANELADVVVVTQDNARSEDPQDIFHDMARGLPKEWGARPEANGDYTWFADASMCIPWESDHIWEMQVRRRPLPFPAGALQPYRSSQLSLRTDSLNIGTSKNSDSTLLLVQPTQLEYTRRARPDISAPVPTARR